MYDNVDAHLFVVFGGTGDLMARKLLPSLYHLSNEGNIGPRFKILATARDTTLDDDRYRKWAREALAGAELRESQGIDRWCESCLHYQSVGDGGTDVFENLRARVDALDEEHDLGGNRTFYLALPPGAFASTIDALGACGLNRSSGRTRLVIEKPFGRDLASATELNELVHRHFDESQVYRIDHYLGKETVQNLLVFRFANPVFESLWNRDRISSVEITVSESLGVGTRARYYDKAGALRDMIQNHLTQLLSLTAMEVPSAFQADPIRDEKVKVLKSIRMPDPADVVFGQYTAGRVGNQSPPGYLDEANVASGSDTETFVAIRLDIDNWRWQGVPFYLRTGKRMPERRSQIVVKFKEPPIALFRDHASCRPNRNALVLTLQPNEGFDLHFDVKTPGQDIAVRTQKLRFEYAEAFGSIPDGYETLVFDILTNDQTLFVRADEVESSWKLYGGLLDVDIPIHTYESGSWGPEASDLLLAKSANAWAVD